MSSDMDLDLLAAHTDGGTGADIKAMCTEAGMFAIREDRDVVTPHDFDLAVEKIHGQNLSKSKTPEGMYA